MSKQDALSTALEPALQAALPAAVGKVIFDVASSSLGETPPHVTYAIQCATLILCNML